MSPLHHHQSTALTESILRILPNRFEQAVARRASLLVYEHERLFHQLSPQIQYVLMLDPLPAQTSPVASRSKPPAKTESRSKQAPLCVGKQRHNSIRSSLAAFDGAASPYASRARAARNYPANVRQFAQRSTHSCAPLPARWPAEYLPPANRFAPRRGRLRSSAQIATEQPPLDPETAERLQTDTAS